MAEELADVVELEALAREEALDGSAIIGAHKGRDIAREEHAEAVVAHAPAHDIEGSGPSVLARRGQGRPFARARDERCRGTVAEERCGDDVALGLVAAPESQAAELDHEKEHALARIDPRHLGRAREPEHAACAAEAEDGEPPQVAAHAEALHHQRIEARRGHARGRDRDDAVDIVDCQPCPLQAVARRARQQLRRVCHEELAALAPPVRLEIPFERHAGITRVDAGIAVDRQQALEAFAVLGEEDAEARLHVLLMKDIVRHGGGKREKSRLLGHGQRLFIVA